MQYQDLVLIGLAAFAFWLLIIRPGRQRREAQQALINRLEPGRRIMTTAGVFGTVVAVADDRVRVEVAPGDVLEMLDQAVSKVLDDEDGVVPPVTPAADTGEDQERDRG